VTDTDRTVTVDCATRLSQALLALAEHDDRVCVVNNDSAETHAAVEFRNRYPDRFVDVGIAEQNLVGTAIGLANGGLLPWVYSAACFLTARATEQIKNAAYTNANVRFCGFVSGFAYGALGGTHHAVEDLAWMRAIPGLKVLAPATPNDTVAAMRLAHDHDGPVYLRIISKELVPELFDDRHRLDFGTGRRLREGSDLTLVGTGLMTTRLVRVAEELARSNIRARVLHLASVCPIDEDEIESAARDTGRLVVAEDHVRNGGLIGAVSEVLTRRHPVPMCQIGVSDVIAPVGPSAYLHRHFGLTTDQITRTVRDWLVT
jgi:transketolase